LHLESFEISGVKDLFSEYEQTGQIPQNGLYTHVSQKEQSFVEALIKVHAEGEVNVYVGIS